MWTKLRPNAIKQKQYCTSTSMSNIETDQNILRGPIVSLNILLRHYKQKSTSINKLKDWILAMDLVNVYESITSIRIDWVNKKHHAYTVQCGVK